ncbi:MAG: hypothetical protein NTX41_01395 [Verrucomicrobia bacterium]|nr:hypothetical protein [Verrucomicrobiota bacterium]
MTLTPFILGTIAIYVVGRLFAAAGEAAPTPPPLPTAPSRRQRKRSPKPTASSPAAISEAPPVAPVVALVPVITQPLIRYGQHAIRKEFSSPAALRRAIIAQEVLGPPLSERPTRI